MKRTPLTQTLRLALFVFSAFLTGCAAPAPTRAADALQTFELREWLGREWKNELVTYAVKTDSQGRPEAHEVSFLSDRYTISPPFLIATGFLFTIAGLVVIEKLPFAVLALYSAASLITFLAYATDKSAA